MEDEDGWLFKADALIQAQLHISPDALSDEEWAMKLRLALWTEARYFNRLGKMFKF
ncbi:MAG: hypothetical protein LBL94_08650 [Prevotellaceae bacterium]|nr:hypothetical protein [Prevotellaceae bacterium]